MASEITEEEDTGSSYSSAEKEAQKRSIRRIIEYQKSLYLSSSSSLSSSSAAMPSSSSSPFSYSRRSNSLMDLMKEGSTSLRRLFDMEHTSLAAYLHDYSGSPVFKPIPLWGSDSDDEIHGDPWSSMKQQMEMAAADESVVHSKGSFVDEEVVQKQRIRGRKLSRKKSFRSLPRFGRLWKFRGFRVFKLRLRRLRIILCGRKF